MCKKCTKTQPFHTNQIKRFKLGQATPTRSIEQPIKEKDYTEEHNRLTRELHDRGSTLLMIGLSSSLSIGRPVLCTQVLVQRWRNRTNEDLQITTAQTVHGTTFIMQSRFRCLVSKSPIALQHHYNQTLDETFRNPIRMGLVLLTSTDT